MMPPNEQESSFPKTPGANQGVTSPVQETRFSSPSHVIPGHDGPSHQSRQSSVLRQSLRPIILKVIFILSVYFPFVTNSLFFFSFFILCVFVNM